MTRRYLVVFLSFVFVFVSDVMTEECVLGSTKRNCSSTSLIHNGEPTCDSHQCKDDEICIIDKVYCKKAPCPLQPTCIPNPCLKKACNRGEVCKLQEVQCFTTPCPPIAICVKDCPQIKCDIYCEYGYKLDKNGCQTCNCAPNPCLTHKCPSGKYCDIERIFCLVAPCPPPRPKCIDPCASVSCPVGSKCVSHNVTCVKAPCPPQPECVEQDCPKYKCKPCEFGYATDENNCQTCNCLPNPCSTILCPIGEVCTLKDDTDCNTYPCPKLPVCVPVCPALKCKTCLYGNVIDKNGCETCQCKDPCADISCKNGEACGLVTVACITQPCPPQPRCVPIDEQYCHFGNPLTIRVHNQDEFVPCNNCPESYECKEGVVGKPVVCCLKSRRLPQDLTTHTSKPPEKPQSMSMLAEDSDISFQPTPVIPTEPLNITKQDNSTKYLNSNSNTTLLEEPKGRALNFTLGTHDNSNVLLNSSVHADRDLSDVSITDDDDDEYEMEIMHSKILASKASINNNSYVNTCQLGGLTYENGQKIENDCDSICTCNNGNMNCTERCARPLIRKGKKIDDPLCFAQSTDDMCCSVLVCAGDSNIDELETEPIEYCSYKNKTYNRGDVYKEGCSEICTCEAGGKMSCKARCPPVSKPNDRCVEIPHPTDSCCKTVVCDVTLEDNESDKEYEMPHKVISAKYVNATTIFIKLDPKLEESDRSLVVEISDDKVNWQKYKVLPGGHITVKDKSRYLKLENGMDITNIQNFEDNPKDIIKNKPSKDIGCQYKDKFFEIGEEYNDECKSLCLCEVGGMKCLKLQCPTYFGVDILDPSCVEWETIPPNFVPSPPTCCPKSIRCKNNGSCEQNGVMYKNWEQLPLNVTGCEKRCYCEMGKVECQNTCPPVTAHPPPNLPCPLHMAKIDHLPDDDCCKYWVCDQDNDDAVTDNIVEEIDKQHKNSTKHKIPSKTLGPLAVYENDHASNIGVQQKPKLSVQENPFYHKNNNTNIKMDKTKNKKTSIFVTPAPTKQSPKDDQIHSEIEIHGHGNPEEILQFINQHPELSSYPSGSVLEIHNLPGSPKLQQNSISNSDKSNIHLVPYVVPQGNNIPEQHLPPGLSLEQLLHEFHRNTLPSEQVSLPHIPNVNKPYLGPIPNKPNMTHPAISGIFNNNFPGYHQPDDDILVHTLEAIGPHTVRLAFMVPPVIVNLHGRVEVKYTNDTENDNQDSWMLQVFAPPNDLIATPSLEFDLQDLTPNTEYKIKITITLRDIHTTHSSRIYTIKTPRELITTTLPPTIPIEPDLAITDINSTWVTVVWKKFDDNELRFIDGVQLRFREIDGKIYAATPLIHRAVTSYTLEKLKPNTKYEIGIFFIPFPGQLTELHAEHMLHFTTANEMDTYGFNVTLEISHIKSQSVEITWSGVPYPEDKYVNIYRAIYQSDSGKEDQSMFKIAKRDSPTKTIVMDLKPGTRYRLWLEVYLTNGKIKTSNVQDFITKPRSAPVLGAATQQDKLSRAEHLDPKGDYYGPLVIVAILAAIAVLSTLVLLMILIRRHNQNKAAITPPSRVSQSAYDNPTYKVEIQQETMGL